MTAFWILGALFTDRVQKLPRWHLMGLSVGALGLLFQGMRNIQFLTTGVSPSDADLPVWFLKDMGYALIAFHSIWLILVGKLRLNNTPAAASAPAKMPAPKRTRTQAAPKRGKR